MKLVRLLLVAALPLLAVSALADNPAPLMNDAWTIKPGGSQEYMVTLAAPTKMKVSILGLKHSDKGFTVQTEEGTEVTKSFNREMKWSAGAHYIRVKNTENAIHRVTVHVRVQPQVQMQTQNVAL